MRLLSVGTDNPGRRYSQEDLLARLKISDRRTIGLFRNSHIKGRFLTLPDKDEETSLELAEKHRTNAIDSGAAAISRALQRAGIEASNVGQIVCVTSTGFLCPSLTAHLAKRLGLLASVRRSDLVGMGCNGGLNGMQAAVEYCASNSGQWAVLACVEICSAAYAVDGSMRTAVVNSLFGDGAAAAVFVGGGSDGEGPRILGFESYIMVEHIDAMRFDFDGYRYSFFLDRDIPYLLGQNAVIPVTRLLERFGLKRRDVRHWIVHSGGRKVIDAIKYSLGLQAADLRHTISVLKDYGNLSSGSFLFSYRRLLEEGVVREGDYVLMMTMGPGSTIECCLGRFEHAR